MASWSSQSPSCPRCNLLRESNLHMIRDCEASVNIWRNFINPRDRVILHTGHLNMSLKEHDFKPPNDPGSFILKTARNHFQAWKNMPITQSLDHSNPKTHWLKPEAGCLGISSPEGAEARGIWCGLNLAWEMGYKKVVIENDCLRIINQITKETNMAHPLHPTIATIKNIISRDWNATMSHCHRNVNTCADKLAKLSLSSCRGLTILDSPPDCISSLVLGDACGLNPPKDLVARPALLLSKEVFCGGISTTAKGRLTSPESERFCLARKTLTREGMFKLQRDRIGR
ncbi:reverse transcriptase [Senna tora]|uniref:Reverse transcriptase n=1 Tax=Senna tora TaxID=362788 RepID=A0A834SQZ5_9FABA|nr:reverse transcriptase [Senna tora]